MILGVVGVIASLLSTGFDVIGADQQLYAPFLKKFADPSLYPGDFVFAGTNFRATAFVPVFGTILRLTHCEITTLQTVGYLIVLLLYLSGIAAVLRRVAPWPAPLWGVLIFSWPLPIPGTGNALYEPNLHPETLGIALALWSLSQLLTERWVVAAALATLTFLLHPLIGVSTLVGGFLGSSAFGRRALVPWTLATGVILLVAHICWPAQRTNLPLHPAAWWQSVAHADYLWFFAWSRSTFVAFGLWFGLALASWRIRDELKLACLARFGLAGVLLLFGAGVGMLLRSPLLVSAQLHRGFWVFELVTLIFIARRLTEALLRKELSWLGWIASAAIASSHSALVVLATLAGALGIVELQITSDTIRRGARHAPALALLVLLILPRRGRYELCAPPGWRALQDWARFHTSIDARFLVPSYFPDFRVFSERSVVLGTQDAVPAIFDEEMARAIAERESVQGAYADRSCPALFDLAKRFNARFLVTEWPCDALRPVHRVAGFYVHEVP